MGLAVFQHFPDYFYLHVDVPQHLSEAVVELPRYPVSLLQRNQRLFLP